MLDKIQAELKAPKGQTNSYAGYKYRSCEDILTALKPILAKNEAWVTLTDTIVQVGDRYYVKATATLKTKDGVVDTADGVAREQDKKLNKSGQETMDHSQITGSTSSYARKYALNGLFAIDDTKDADSDENVTQATTEPQMTCEQCGKVGMKAKDGKGNEMTICPDWQKHKAAGETFNCK